MRCPSCGTEAIAGKQFCHACGARLTQKCPGCGAVVEPTYKFCPDCGTNLSPSQAPGAAPPPPPIAPGDDRLERFTKHIPDALARKILASKGTITGERKLVTVLFCDLAGSTSIAEGLDPEEYHDLLEQYLELAFREIYRFEGIVNQLAGDGLMALFGAPVAHEDAPHRALRAALAIRDVLARFNEDARRQGRPELRARMGVHTGPVVVGTVGNDFKMDYTAIGDTTNLASRLQGLADPGSVLVSEGTHRLVRGFFKVRPTGPLEIRGKSDPVTAYEVISASEVATPMAVAAARGLTPFVGREPELARLTACFDLLEQSLPQVVAVIGEAGSGKSRLLYEFRRALADRPVTVFEARCSSMTQSLPYAPWVGMLRQFFGLRPGEASECACDKLSARLAELGIDPDDVYPYLCRLLSLPAKGATERPADEIKEQTFEAMARLVLAAASRAPAILVIEDLHWIDDPSREMLELAVAELHKAPVMVVVSHRPDYQPAWRARVAFSQLVLRRLSDDDSRAIVRSLAGGPLPEELEKLILVKAEGNAFFAEEITRALIDEGYLIRGDRHVRLTRPVSQIRIPDTIQELIGARLDRLAAGAKRVLQVASVFGRQFRRDPVARILGSDPGEVLAELRALEEGGVVHRKNVLSEDEYRFGESLTQEVAYEGLLLKERRQLHEQIAGLLEGEPGERTADHSALIAHHLLRSDNKERAITALNRAAQDAEALPSFRSAAKFYRQAWDLAEPLLGDGASEGLRRAALDAAGGFCRMAVIYASSDVELTERIAPRAIELAESLGDVERVTGLYVLHGLGLASGRREKFQEGVSRVERGLALASRAGQEAVTVSITRGLTWAYILDGRFDLAEKSVDHLMTTLQRSGDADRLSDLYFGSEFLRNALHFYRDEIEHAEAGARRTHELALKANNRTVQSGSAAWLATAHFGRTEYEQAREWADKSLEVADRIGNVSAQRTAAILALGARLELGDSQDAARYVERIELDYQARGDMALKSHAAVEALLALGEVERARRFVEHAFPYAGGRLREILSAIAQADVLRHLETGHLAEADRWYRNAIDLATEIPLRSAIAHATLGRAEVSAAQGEREVSEQRARQALEIYRQLRLQRYAARAESLLARLSTAA